MPGPALPFFPVLRRASIPRHGAGTVTLDLRAPAPSPRSWPRGFSVRKPKPRDRLVPPLSYLRGVRRFFQNSVPEKSKYLRLWDPSPKISWAKSGRGNSVLLWGDPYFTPWPTPDRGFQAPMMAISPETRTFLWAGGGCGGINGLEASSQRARGARSKYSY